MDFSVNSTNRKSGLDILKLVAMTFVIVLHINGYLVALNGLSAFDFLGRLIYNLTEAFAYPATHLFVLIASYLMLDKKIAVRSIINVWLQTITVTIVGLLLIVAFCREIISLEGVLISIFPLITKAYWFVSLYVVLLIFSPFLSLLIRNLNDKQLHIFTSLICSIYIIMPTFFNIFNWDGDDFALFLCLYFIAACFKRAECKGVSRTHLWLLLSFISIILLVLSVYAIELASNYINMLSGHEYYFYQYSSVLVVSSAVGMFGFLKNIRITNERTRFYLSKLAGCSLITYLIHMHPMLKNYYTQWKLLSFVPVQKWSSYLFYVFILCLSIFAVGEAIGYFIVRFANKISKPLSSRIIKVKPLSYIIQSYDINK